ncbi:hypothetical protein ACKLNO_01150 [Neisseriaceae bacterium B1]
MCRADKSKIKVEGLTFGESKSALLQRLPSLQQADIPTNHYFFSPDMAGLHFDKRVAFVTWISYDKRGQIDGWRFVIGDQAKGEIDLNTSPEKLKAELIQRYDLPKIGWQKHITDEDVTEYIYTCHDYSINIHQDYGAVRQGSGAAFTVTRKPF